MSREHIAFTVLIVILVLGIFIMIKPHFFVLQMQVSEKPSVNQPFNGQIVPKGIITLASTFIIVGIVGLCVLGFRIFKELGLNDTQKSA
jgi:Mn2+/Fe2+ NRAMP family transporter